MNSSPSSSSASLSACEAIAESFRPYLEGSLTPNESAAVLAHLNVCADCKAEFNSRQKVLSLLNQTYGEKRADARSIIQLLALGVRQGSPITVVAEGADAPQALDAVMQVLAGQHTP